MRSPIWWYGGKGNMTAKLLPLVPPHHTYVEPFGGGASLLFAKPPSPVEVYNDIHSRLVGFFRVLRNPEQFERLHRMTAMTPYSREEYFACRDSVDEGDAVERAWKFLIVARMSFSGRWGGSWGFTRTQTNRGMSEKVSLWLSSVAALPQVHARLQCVQIEHGDWRTVLEAYDTPETFFYLDPPYLQKTRSGTRYEHDLPDDAHAELLAAIKQLEGMVMLSGYPCTLYDQALVGWERRQWKTACHATGKTRATGILGEGAALEKQVRTEVAWMNYRVQKRLI